jgi:hypothetical protein
MKTRKKSPKRSHNICETKEAKIYGNCMVCSAENCSKVEKNLQNIITSSVKSIEGQEIQPDFILCKKCTSDLKRLEAIEREANKIRSNIRKGLEKKCSSSFPVIQDTKSNFQSDL